MYIIMSFTIHASNKVLLKILWDISYILPLSATLLSPIFRFHTFIRPGYESMYMLWPAYD